MALVSKPSSGRGATTLRSRSKGTVSAQVTELGGRTVVQARIDPTVRRGALDEVSGLNLAAAARLALDQRLPLVAVITSSGADVNDGVAALHGWGTAAAALAACSGVVPSVFVVTGPTVSGPSLLLGLADIVIFTETASAYVMGPGSVESFTGEVVTVETLGGANVHRSHTGVAAAIVPDELAGLELAEVIIALLPGNCDEEPPSWPNTDPIGRLTPEAGDCLPTTATGSYDIRNVIHAIADDGDFVELWAGWARNMVVGLTTIGGRAIGVLGNQPMALAGTLNIPASQKGARFVAFCDAFNIPLVTLVDTPGFFPGKDLEWRGMIRHGAQLVGAYARATVPRVCVLLRKAYGGAYIVMDSKRMGNDVCLAWPTAELAVMGARQAVEVLHRRESDEVKALHEATYTETLLNPWIAAERGLIDMVIEPAETRRVVAEALEMLTTKREVLGPRRHDNLPL